MRERVILELPDNVARSAKEVATRTERQLEDVLVEWIDATGCWPAGIHQKTDDLLNPFHNREAFVELARALRLVQ